MKHRPAIHAIVLAGGRGRRLGGVSKADLSVGGRRLLDVVLDGIAPVVTGRRIVVGPPGLEIPASASRTFEDPPGGGPLAGIGAGVQALGEAGGWCLVCAVDTPGIAAMCRQLAQVMDECGGCDGVVAYGGSPQPFRQYLQAIYRLEALRRVLVGAGSLHSRGVTRVLGELPLAELPVDAALCRDLDTVADLEHWRGLASS